MIVLDTNVISELMRAQPAAAVVHWVNARAATNLYLTSLTQAEVLYGIRLLPKGKRREAISDAAEQMFESDFRGRILAFGPAAASAYAQVAAERRGAGRPIAASDAQIAAIVLANEAELATRNVDDFAGCGIDLVNPWTA
jgi:predicted nucleic acid-binding protein